MNINNDNKYLKQVQTINQKVDTLVYLTAMKAMHGYSFETKCDLLTRLGFTLDDIVLITGKTKKDVKHYLNWKDVKK